MDDACNVSKAASLSSGHDEAGRTSVEAAPNAPSAEGLGLRVGQQLWFVRNDRRWGSDEFVTVTKVGRKWAEIGPYRRIDINTLRVDGGGYASPGTCYRNKTEYEIKAATEKAFERLRSAIGYARRDGVTLEDIEQAARLLRIDIGGAS